MRSFLIGLGTKFSVAVALVVVSTAPSHAQWWKKATDGSLDPTNRNNDFGSYIDTNKLDVTPRYETNKFDLKAKVEEGGWHVAWADDIAEVDVAQGAVSVGVSVFAGNPGPFIAWLEFLIERTVASFERNTLALAPQVRGQIRDLAFNAIKNAIAQKDANELTRAFGGVGVKAGAIKYSGSNKIGKTVVSKTWGIKPYIAIRLVNPNGVVLQQPQPVTGGVGRHVGRPRMRGNSGYVFENVKPGIWIAIAPNGNVVADFEEAERTRDFVGLKSHNRFPHIRLFQNHTEEFIPHNRRLEWVRVESGQWLQ